MLAIASEAMGPVQHGFICTNVVLPMQIIINRPHKRNAFRPRTVQELSLCFADARDDPDVGVVVLTGPPPSARQQRSDVHDAPSITDGPVAAAGWFASFKAPSAAVLATKCTPCARSPIRSRRALPTDIADLRVCRTCQSGCMASPMMLVSARRAQGRARSRSAAAAIRRSAAGAATSAPTACRASTSWICRRVLLLRSPSPSCAAWVAQHVFCDARS